MYTVHLASPHAGPWIPIFGGRTEDKRAGQVLSGVTVGEEGEEQPSLRVRLGGPLFLTRKL